MHHFINKQKKTPTPPPPLERVEPDNKANAKNNQQMNNSTIARLLSGCVESLRISEYWAATAAREIEMQKEFENLKEDEMYLKWLEISHASFLRAAELAAMWRQRAECEWLEAKRLGYNGPFDRLYIKYSPPLAAPMVK